MGSKSFSYRDVLGFGWDVMKNNFWFFVGVGITLLLISLPSQVLGNVMENYPGKIPPPLAILLLAVTFIVEIITGIGLIKIIGQDIKTIPPAFLFDIYFISKSLGAVAGITDSFGKVINIQSRLP